MSVRGDGRGGFLWKAGGVVGAAVVLTFLVAVVAALWKATEARWISAGFWRLTRGEVWRDFDRWAPLACILGAGTWLAWSRRVRPGGRRGDGVDSNGRTGERLLPALAAAGATVLALRLAVVVAAPSPSGPNVLLISIDTLRADRLGTYGHAPPTSPTIDSELAGPGVVFERCYSQSPKTTPSHMTMLTSLYPCVHGVPLWEGTKPGPVLSESVHTLAEVLQNAGYATAAFTGHGHIHKSRGFDQGFEVYKHGDQLRRARRWMGRHRNRRFFLFFHTYAVHDPYLPPADLVDRFAPDYRGKVRETVDRLRGNDREWERAHEIFWKSVDKGDPRDVLFVQRLYDAAIRNMDESILKPLLARLTELDLDRDTLVVLTSDHGEAFGEHGAFLHGDLYRETLHVPLVMRWPGRIPAGRRIEAPVRLLDVMPTVLELVGVERLAALQGRSLVGLIEGHAPASGGTLVVSEHEDPALGKTMESVRRGALTYISNGPDAEPLEELFDDSVDPSERENVAARRPRELGEMRSALSEWRAGCRELARDLGPKREGPPPSEQTARQLRALGYIE